MLDDLTLAWKRLRTNLSFTFAAVITLALAVGANAAIFMVADAVLFRPLPYQNPDRLFLLRAVEKNGLRSSAVPYEYIQALQQHHTGVVGVALRSTPTMGVHVGGPEAEWIESFVAAADYFQVLGVRPVRGRLLDDRDAAEGPRRTMLTHESWRTRFGGDEGIVGREVSVGGAPRTVVGILPPGFITAAIFCSARPASFEDST